MLPKLDTASFILLLSYFFELNTDVAVCIKLCEGLDVTLVNELLLLPGFCLLRGVVPIESVSFLIIIERHKRRHYDLRSNKKMISTNIRTYRRTFII